MAATLDDVLSELQKLSANSTNLNNFISKTYGASSKSTATTTTSSSSSISKLFDDMTNPAKKVTDGINKVFQIGISQTLDYAQDRVMDINNSLQTVADIFSKRESALLDLAGQIVMQIEDELTLRTKINEETGLTGELSEDLRQSIVNSIPGTLLMGYGIERMAEFYTTLVDQSGKFTLLNQDVLVRTAQVTRAFTGDITKTAQYISEYQKIGVGAADTLEAINKIGVKSLELGLKSKKTVEDVSTNIGKLNEYGFKNGIQGLAEMARKATEFRMSFDEVFKVADKVFSPEGAIELSANLSIIGGQLGAFNDPLKLMYMATNNVEGLQDALIGAAKNLATYNVEQGRFEITGINLRKAKAMADELGISYSEFAKGAVAAAERTQAATALMSTGLQMKDDDREFLTNLAQMEKGEMVIRVPESLAARIGSPMVVQLNQMTSELKNELIKNKDAFAQMDAKDIAMQQLTLQEQINRNVMAIAAVAKVRISQMIREVPKGNIMETVELLAAKFGKNVEDFTKIDVKTGRLSLLPGAEDVIEKVKGVIGDATGGTKALEMIQSYLKSNEEKKKTEEEKTIVENRFTFNATPSLLDSLGRHIARSPQTWEDIYGAHSENRKSYTYGGRGF